MMTLNLAPTPSLGPVFDSDASGWRRLVPRRPWWPILPVLVVGAPAIAAVVVVQRLSELRRG